MKKILTVIVLILAVSIAVYKSSHKELHNYDEAINNYEYQYYNETATIIKIDSDSKSIKFEDICYKDKNDFNINISKNTKIIISLHDADTFKCWKVLCRLNSDSYKLNAYNFKADNVTPYEIVDGKKSLILGYSPYRYNVVIEPKNEESFKLDLVYGYLESKEFSKILSFTINIR